MIEILSTGLLNSVQDLGRKGQLSIGVSQSGAMDSLALVTANALVGNDDSAAALEICIFPFRLRFQADLTFACTGASTLVKLDDRTLPPWWAYTARAGQTLSVEPPTHGARVYVAVQGGFDIPLVLGSRATDLKSGLGGLEGRGLRRGDVLATCAAPTSTALRNGRGVIPPELPAFMDELAAGLLSLRVLPAAQYDEFTNDSQGALTSTDYVVSRDANRMGYRLAGQALQRRTNGDLFSHGLVPGTVQVPPSGQPIIQLAEANTCGGYPKIANVIQADLWRLGQAPIGARIRFVLTGLEEAVSALRAQTEFIASARRELALVAGRS